MFDKKNRNTNKGFTLIELLVVITIISLLSVIAVVAVNKQRLKARNIKRMHDADLLIKAAEMYRAEHGEFHDKFGSLAFDGILCCLGYQPSEQCFESDTWLPFPVMGCGNDINQLYQPFLKEMPTAESLHTSSSYKNDKVGYIWYSQNLFKPYLFWLIFFEGEDFDGYEKCRQASLFFPPWTRMPSPANVSVCGINMQDLMGY